MSPPGKATNGVRKVAVIGYTKVGKSTFINIVTGHPHQITREINEDTAEICQVPHNHDGKAIILVDTPGITDTRPVVTIIVDLATSVGSDITVLYVHCITDTMADFKPIASIAKLCGPGNTIANLSIITTKWTEGTERSRAAEKERLNAYLTANNLCGVVGDPLRFNDSKDSAERILMDALKKPPVTPPYSPSGALSGQVADHAPAGNGAAKGKDESGGCCCVQ